MASLVNAVLPSIRMAVVPSQKSWNCNNLPYKNMVAFWRRKMILICHACNAASKSQVLKEKTMIMTYTVPNWVLSTSEPITAMIICTPLTSSCQNNSLNDQKSIGELGLRLRQPSKTEEIDCWLAVSSQHDGKHTNIGTVPRLSSRIIGFKEP